MNQHEFTTSVERDHLSFFYDTRSRNIEQIQAFLASDRIIYLQESIEKRAYIVLGWDGLFVHVAKIAYQDEVPLLGINFGTKGFLLHDRDVFDQKWLTFDTREYPILHADVRIGDTHTHGYAFNEVYLTRAGDASSVRLSLTQRGKILDPFIGDGLMISTPAGSTGWSRSYGWVVLPHDANLNVLTPFGKIFPREFFATVLPDKGRIHIKNDTTREAPVDILVDNRRIVSMETREFELTIERAARWVQLLIEQWYRERWDAKAYEEQGMKMVW
jgi:NAD+ kinase